MELKQTCRTCKHLEPTVYGDYYWDSEENTYEAKYPCNCDYVQYSNYVDSPTKCEHYEPIDIKWIMED